ncbi:uncharacterized protein LOC141588744 [Silene latifolia]|uniref:uncharacterized protein LOC141588744 n=1 Tax=Silene latifolia TaxID=37657 RepID=UPI003D77352E
MWDILKNYSGKCYVPWAIGGDFNNVLTYQERIGGEVIPAEIQPFQDCINFCQLQDIKAVDSYFTWTNKQGVDTRKYSRLDRILENGDWLQRFPEAFANFMPEGIFDHCPCVVQFGAATQRKHASFKYYNMWSLFSGFTQIVGSHWDDQIDGTPIFKLITNLKKVKRPLKDINKENFHDIEHTTSLTLMALTQLQERLRVTPLDPALIMAERDVNRVHKTTVQKGRVITNEHHEKLLRKVTAEEIRLAMFVIPGTKAPGPDGYSSQFFKDIWSITGTAVCDAIMDFFENGKLLKQVNNIVLTLVPKVDMPLSVTQFRPIACCNTIYKCIAKLLCNRLSDVLPHIISPNQSAFVKGRDIVENIIVCQDLVKLYGRKLAHLDC